MSSPEILSSEDPEAKLQATRRYLYDRPLVTLLIFIIAFAVSTYWVKLPQSFFIRYLGFHEHSISMNLILAVLSTLVLLFVTSKLLKIPVASTFGL